MKIRRIFLIILGIFLFFIVKQTGKVQAQILNPIVWKTGQVKLASSNFYIKIGDKFFYGKEPLDIRSDPGLDRTTLETTWHENDVEMRLFLYFRKIANGMWEMYEMRTYNGDERGNWLYYQDSLGNKVQNLIGERDFRAERIFNSQTGAQVYCKDCSIQAFIKKLLPVSAYGYSLDFRIGLSEDETITITTNPLTGYGVNAVLLDAKGEVVENQNPFKFEYYAEDPQILSLYSQSVPYPDNKCAYDILPPCPQINIQISGKKLGVTRILGNVIRKEDNVQVASNSFDVRVVDQNASQEEEISEKEPSNEELKEEMSELKGEVGRISKELETQKGEISGLKKFLETILEYLQKFFNNIF